MPQCALLLGGQALYLLTQGRGGDPIPNPKRDEHARVLWRTDHYVIETRSEGQLELRLYPGQFRRRERPSSYYVPQQKHAGWRDPVASHDLAKKLRAGNRRLAILRGSL